MKHKKRPDLVILFLLLAVACLGLAVPVALLDPRWLALPALLMIFDPLTARLTLKSGFLKKTDKEVETK